MLRSPRPFVLCAALACGLFAAPSQSQGCWLFGGLFGHRSPTTFRPAYRPVFPTTSYYAPTTAYYRPVTSYYAPTTSYYAPTTTYYAPQSQTCNYVPVTSYRPQVVNRPVTTLRPVVSYDRCTGCSRTTYRPVTGYVSQVYYQPTTSYRLQCSACYTPAADCYAPGGYPATNAADTMSDDTAAPRLSPGSATPQDTFRQDTDADAGNQAGGTGQQTRALRPIPDANTNGANGQNSGDIDSSESDADGDSLILNDPNNRTAQATSGWRIRTAVARENELKPRVIPAVDRSNTKSDSQTSDDGWRAAKKN